MALTLERVKLADVYPLVDEYGNEFVSRDYELDANKEYVSELAASFKDGEPDEPVKLVRDGDVYRIKAGNTRVRAMKELGTQECWAVIDDDDTVQSVVETVVRTNTKKKYERLEESRFTQQLFLFGDDEYVGHVSGIGAENAAKVRVARKMAGDKSDQMSLDRMYALSEFEDYPELAERIIDAKEGLLGTRIYEVRRDKKRIITRQALEAEAERLKIKIVDDTAGKRYISACYEPGELSAKYMAASADYKSIVGKIEDTWDGCSLILYGKHLHEEQETAERAERRKRIDQYEEVLDSIDEDTLAWVRWKLDVSENGLGEGPDAMPALMKRAKERLKSLWWMDGAMKLLPEYKDWPMGGMGFALGYEQSRCLNNMFGETCEDGKAFPKVRADRLKSYLAWVGYHMDDGWEPSEGQSAVIELAKKALENSKDEEAGE